MQVNIPLDLETECWACDGTGTPDLAMWTDENGKCVYCDGAGTQLTDFGHAVIKMLNRHKSKLK
jgi:DnaJ-class molecular chaperone